MPASNTMVGRTEDDILRFTVGRDPVLDTALVEADCLGTAAHVTMLASLNVHPAILSRSERSRVVAALLRIMRRGRAGRVRITQRDQDVHLAIERLLTRELGETGRKIHTGRSRNDQVAVDLRLFAKVELLRVVEDSVKLGAALLAFARRHRDWPMVGRTHLQPAMPGSVGLWSSAHVESLLDDLELVRTAYEQNNRSPLGSAAGFGVPLPIDPEMTSRLLGFAGCFENVLYASNARGKCEGAILVSLAFTMQTLARLADDLVLYSTPEFGYFSVPAGLCTGSSIMPQKRNPDVLELVRARAARVWAHETAVRGILRGLPSGYHRDLQETKEPLMDGFDATQSCLRVMRRLMAGLEAHRDALEAGFRPDVFAADRALELVAGGLPFRDAYHAVRRSLDSVRKGDAAQAVRARTHRGAPGGLDLGRLGKRLDRWKKFVFSERTHYHAAISKLLGTGYPDLENEVREPGAEGET